MLCTFWVIIFISPSKNIDDTQHSLCNIIYLSHTYHTTWCENLNSSQLESSLNKLMNQSNVFVLLYTVYWVPPVWKRIYTTLLICVCKKLIIFILAYTKVQEWFWKKNIPIMLVITPPLNKNVVLRIFFYSIDLFLFSHICIWHRWWITVLWVGVGDLCGDICISVLNAMSMKDVLQTPRDNL